MTRIDWAEPGAKQFEAGVDRGVLYVGANPGVPWVGLIGVEVSNAGGDVKERFLDGVMISNRSEAERFEATLEAFTYPKEFEPCDGIGGLQNGLRAMHQGRKPFNLCYRTKIGNDLRGLDAAYRLHLIYNARAEPTSRAYSTLSDENEPISFSWALKTRHTLVDGLRPVSYFSFDSREVPAELLANVEALLYGDENNEPRIPTPGELVFMFDSFEDNVYDAGDPYTPVFVTYDAGDPNTTFTNTIDGGAI